MATFKKMTMPVTETIALRKKSLVEEYGAQFKRRCCRLTSSSHTNEIAANLERAEPSLPAARQLAANANYDFAASRPYYAAFYAATAVLLDEGVGFGKHTGVISSIHTQFSLRRAKILWRQFAC